MQVVVTVSRCMYTGLCNIIQHHNDGEIFYTVLCLTANSCQNRNGKIKLSHKLINLSRALISHKLWSSKPQKLSCHMTKLKTKNDMTHWASPMTQ